MASIGQGDSCRPWLPRAGLRGDDFQLRRLAIEHGPGQHAAAETQGNRDITVGQDVDLHLAGEVERILAFQRRRDRPPPESA